MPSFSQIYETLKQQTQESERRQRLEKQSFQQKGGLRQYATASELEAQRPTVRKDKQGKRISQRCQEVIEQLQQQNIDYSCKPPSQIELIYNDRCYLLDLRTKENKWYALTDEGAVISKGYAFTTLERFTQSVNRYTAEFVL